jgi:sugar/nucleoside kinase (ribokinase family)
VPDDPSDEPDETGRRTVLACGLATLDVVQTVDHVPGADEKLVATDLLVTAGGPAANGAATAAALGARAALVSRVGGSPVGRLVAADLAAAGVALDDRAGPDDAPAVSTVLLTRGTGTRAVVSVNATLRAGDAPGVDEIAADLTGVGAVLVDGHHLDLAVGIAAAARDARVPVLLDGGSWKPGLERLLALVDVAVVSADLVVPATLSPLGGPHGDPLAAVAALGPAVVARSRGGRPIEVLVAGGRHEVPVPTVEVADTLGAGDALHGAAAFWLAGAPTPGPADVLAGLAWAAAVASASCTAPGARAWATDRAAVSRLLDELPPTAGPR